VGGGGGGWGWLGGGVGLPKPAGGGGGGGGGRGRVVGAEEAGAAGDEPALHDAFDTSVGRGDPLRHTSRRGRPPLPRGRRRAFLLSSARAARRAAHLPELGGQRMAEIILGIGPSHSRMVGSPPEPFAAPAARDRARVPNFQALARDKAGWIARELAPDVTRVRHEATQAALARLGAALAEAAPDVLVVVGDDQAEWFSADSQPALCIYWGDAVENLPPPLERMAPSLRRAYWGYYGDGTNRAFPLDAGLGRHLVETLTREHEFDVAHMRVQPRHAPFGHA